jgi:hypothetical protein
MQNNNDRMMTFHIPPVAMLVVLGEIALRMDIWIIFLRMTIKSIIGVSTNEAMDGTAFEGLRTLRHRLQRIAKSRLGECAALVKFQALLERCRSASERRNELTHRTWGQELDGAAKIRNDSHGWDELPTVEALRALAIELETITAELNTARLHGFLAEALEKKPSKYELNVVEL